MSKGLAYFKEVYDEVPGWVQKMNDYNSKVLDHYTAIRSEIMQDGVLSRKEKDALIAVMNAGRNYERSMLYHTKGAVDFGCTLEELAELFLVAYAYAGESALEKGAIALQYALSLKGTTVSIPEGKLSESGLLDLIQSWLEQPSPIIKEAKDSVGAGKKGLEAILLADGAVSAKLKHLAMVGSYTTELDGKGAAPWMEQARLAGATEAELAEVGYICILTAGIPSWFELSDSLKEKSV